MQPYLFPHFEWPGHHWGTAPLETADTDVPFFPRSGTSPLQISVLIAFGADIKQDPETWQFYEIPQREVLYARGITIQRGVHNTEFDEEDPPPGTLAIRLLDENGKYSPKNPFSPWAGMLRRNTPLRIMVNRGTGWHTRATMFIPDFNPKRDITGNFSYVDIDATARTRQLKAGKKPLRSAFYRAVTRASPAILDKTQAYWPLEDEAQATSAASGIVGGTALSIQSGDLGFAGMQGPDGSASLLNLANHDGRLQGLILPPSNPTSYFDDWMAQFLIKVPPDKTTGVELMRWTISNAGASLSQVVVKVLSVIGGPIHVDFWDSVSIFLTLTTGSFVLDDGQWHRIEIILNYAGGIGSDLSYQLFVDNFSNGPVVQAGLAGSPDGLTIGITNLQGGSNSLSYSPAIGHVRFVNLRRAQDEPKLYQTSGAINGFAGERAANRFIRLGAEEKVATDVPLATPVQVMGAQRIDTLPNHFKASALAVEGAQVAARFDGRIGLDPSDLRYNQAVTMRLDWSAHELTEVPSLPSDDRYIRNDVTVRRVGGSSVSVTDSTGPLGTETVGRYDEQKDLVLSNDDQTLHHASLRLQRGTVNEPRLVGVRFYLGKSQMADVFNQWLNMDIGKRYQIVNTPIPYAGTQIVDALLLGYTEMIDQYGIEVTAYGIPSSAFEVFEISTGADNRSRIPPTLGKSTILAIDDVGTSLQVISETTPWIDGSFETIVTGFEISIGSWIGELGATVALTTAQAQEGIRSLEVTATGANAGAQHTAVTTEFPAATGAAYSLSMRFRAAATARTCQVLVSWYDVFGGLIQTDVVASAADSTAVWTQVTGTVAAASGTFFAVVRGRILATVAAEVHYIDNVVFAAVNASQFPIDIIVGPANGIVTPEQMRVLAITGSGSLAQGMRIQRGINGIAVKHNLGEVVDLWRAPVIALGSV